MFLLGPHCRGSLFSSVASIHVGCMCLLSLVPFASQYVLLHLCDLSPTVPHVVRSEVFSVCLPLFSTSPMRSPRWAWMCLPLLALELDCHRHSNAHCAGLPCSCPSLPAPAVPHSCMLPFWTRQSVPPSLLGRNPCRFSSAHKCP